MWECKMAQLLWKSFSLNQKINIQWTFDPIIPLLGIIPTTAEIKYSVKCMCTHVHSKTIHNCQKVEIIQIFINRCVNKQIMVYLNNRIFFSHNKTWSTDTCYIVDESHYVKWKDPNTKDLRLCNSIYMTYQE